MKLRHVPYIGFLALAVSGCAELEMYAQQQEMKARQQEMKARQQEMEAQQHQLNMDRMQCEQSGLAYGMPAFAGCMTNLYNVRAERAYQDAQFRAQQQKLNTLLKFEREKREEEERRRKDREFKREFERKFQELRSNSTFGQSN